MVKVFPKILSENLGLLLSASNSKISLPKIPSYATCNAHMFYIVCSCIEERNQLIQILKDNGVYSVFHYLSLHKSPYYLKHFSERPVLGEADKYTDRLLRLPMFYELLEEEIKINN